SPYSGQEVTLIFETKGSYPIEPPFKREPNTENDFAVLSNPRIGNQAKQSRPNIILALVDALRPDHLGCYGYSRETSPNIDRIAREGVIFSNAISQASWTWPSVASLFTSLYPSQHKVTKIFGYPLSNSLTTLAEIMRDEGYTTGVISSNLCISEVFQFDQGFDYFNKRCSSFGCGDDAECITNQILTWLEMNYDSSFFIYLHYMDPHAPFDPPSLFKGIIDKPNNFNNINRIISNYNGDIRFVDYHMGKLLSKLRELGMDDNTLFIIIADHGEEIYEHGGIAHGPTLYEEVLRIPVIFRYPALFPKGKVVEEIIQTIDIAPTILDVAGIQEFKDMEGSSLLPLLSDKDRSLKSIVFSETGKFRVRGKMTLQSKRWKLISDYSNTKIELYDLHNDPYESHNLISEESELVLDLLKSMNCIQKSLEFSEQPPEEKVKINEEMKERLRSLGYIH
ncbi:MAG: sulfatase, partial [Deltaproteobacteria bacterium]